MTKYVKKPVVVEAMRWEGTAESATPIIDWILSNEGTARYAGPVPPSPDCPTPEYHVVHRYCPSCEFVDEEVALRIDTLEGTMSARPGDWIIRGTEGEFYPCKPEPFAVTFEAVEDTPERPEQKGPKTTRLAVIEVDHPGYRVMSAEVAMPLGDPVPSLDNVAIQLHELANDLIMAIRKAGPK